jgi:hypothetical protein
MDAFNRPVTGMSGQKTADDRDHRPCLPLKPQKIVMLIYKISIVLSKVKE